MLLLCIVNGSFATVGIFLNSLVILSFWKSAKLRKQQCYFMILVLACTDLVVVAVIHPLLVYSAILWFTNYDKFHFIFDPFFGFSMFSLLTMNLERYWAVRHPYFHQRSITKRRLLGLLLIFWLFVVVMSVVSHKKVIEVQLPGLAILGAILLLIIYINYQMLVTVRTIKRNEAKRMLTMRCSADTVENLNQSATERSPNERSHPNSVSTCFMAVLCFFVCSLPVLVHNGIWFAKEDTLADKIRMPLLLWAQTFLSMNSTFNCLIFFYKTRALSCEGKKLLKTCGLFVENEQNPGTFV